MAALGRVDERLTWITGLKELDEVGFWLSWMMEVRPWEYKDGDITKIEGIITLFDPPFTKEIMLTHTMLDLALSRVEEKLSYDIPNEDVKSLRLLVNGYLRDNFRIFYNLEHVPLEKLIEMSRRGNEHVNYRKIRKEMRIIREATGPYNILMVHLAKGAGLGEDGQKRTSCRIKAKEAVYGRLFDGCMELKVMGDMGRAAVLACACDKRFISSASEKINIPEELIEAALRSENARTEIIEKNCREA